LILEDTICLGIMSVLCRDDWVSIKIETKGDEPPKTVFVKKENVVEVVKTYVQAEWGSKCVIHVLRNGEIVEYVPSSCLSFLQRNVYKPQFPRRPDTPRLDVEVSGIKTLCSIM
jgi:hypothetical protein